MAVEKATGTNCFTHVVAVAKVTGEESIWVEDELFRENIGRNPLKILKAKEMFKEIKDQLSTSNALASTQVGRLIQIIRASEYDFSV